MWVLWLRSGLTFIRLLKTARFTIPSPRGVSAMTREIACSPRRCYECGATKTPMWRTGPAGASSLCNACGVRWGRLKRCRLAEEIRVQDHAARKRRKMDCELRRLRARVQEINRQNMRLSRLLAQERSKEIAALKRAVGAVRSTTGVTMDLTNEAEEALVISRFVEAVKHRHHSR